MHFSSRGWFAVVAMAILSACSTGTSQIPVNQTGTPQASRSGVAPRQVDFVPGVLTPAGNRIVRAHEFPKRKRHAHITAPAMQVGVAEVASVS